MSSFKICFALFLPFLLENWFFGRARPVDYKENKIFFFPDFLPHIHFSLLKFLTNDIGKGALGHPNRFAIFHSWVVYFFWMAFGSIPGTFYIVNVMVVNHFKNMLYCLNTVPLYVDQLLCHCMYISSACLKFLHVNCLCRESKEVIHILRT